MSKPNSSKKIPPRNENNYTADYNKKSILEKYQYFIAIITLGTFLRFYNLGWNSLWLDEASTYLFAKMNIIDIWRATSGGEFNPPLFYIVEHLMLYLSSSEAALRIIPAVSGIATIVIFYFIGTTLKNEKFGIILSFIIATLPFHIIYSQEARAYTLMLFFISVALYSFIKVSKDNDNQLKWWISTGVFSSLAFWTHFYSIIFILGIFIFALFVHRKQIKNVVISIATFAILSLPLLIVMKDLFLIRTASAPTYGIQGVSIITVTLSSFFIDNILLIIIFLFLLVSGHYIMYQKDPYLSKFFITTTVIAIFTSIYLSTKIPMLPRYLIILLPLVLIPIVYSLYNSNKIITYGILGIFLIGCISFYIPYYTTYTKEDWRGISSDISNITVPGDTVYIIPAYIKQPFDYYSNDTDISVIGVSSIKNLTDKPNGSSYYIITPDVFSIPDGTRILNWINTNTAPISQYNSVLIAKDV